MNWIGDRLAERIWKKLAEREANSGLWTNEPPILEPTKKIHRRLLAEGKIQEAMAFQAVVPHNVWTKQRASDDPMMQKISNPELMVSSESDFLF